MALQTVQRIGPILDLFTIDRPEWGVSEVAAKIGVPRSSAHALLSSLVETGLLQSRSRGRYRIGWRIVELSQTLNGTVDVRSCAAPVIQALSEKYSETTHLAVMERYRVLYVDKVLGTHIINVAGARVGAHLDAHCSAVGKVLMAYCDPGEVERNITNKPLRRLTPTTITNPAALAQELRGVRSAGCAFDAGEAVTEVHCVAAPVRDDMGVVVAAVSMSVPVSRFVPAQREFKNAVIAAGNEISRQLVAAVDGERGVARPRTRGGAPSVRLRHSPALKLARES